MKLFFTVLRFFLIQQCCTGNPVAERELSEDVLPANSTSVEYWFEVFNETSSNDSSSMDIRSQNAGNKGSDKTFKDKMKTGVEKLKNKMNEIKNKIGSGGMPGGVQYMNRHNRNDYRSRSNIGAGSGKGDPRDKWVAVGLVIFFTVGILGIIIYYKFK